MKRATLANGDIGLGIIYLDIAACINDDLFVMPLASCQGEEGGDRPYGKGKLLHITVLAKMNPDRLYRDCN
jgi:hypothetical protein